MILSQDIGCCRHSLNSRDRPASLFASNSFDAARCAANNFHNYFQFLAQTFSFSKKIIKSTMLVTGKSMLLNDVEGSFQSFALT